MARVRLVGVLAVVAAIALAGVASGAKIKNGDFEKGSLQGWQTEESPAVQWQVYDKDSRNPTPVITRGGGSEVRPLPKPVGKFSIFPFMEDANVAVIYRQIKIPNDAKWLKLKAYWQNYEYFWIQEGTFESPGPDDQYFSIDLIKPSADPLVTSGSAILANIYQPEEDLFPMPRRGMIDPNYIHGWKGFKTNVKGLRGEKVVLRLAEVAMNEYNFEGIDNVKVK